MLVVLLLSNLGDGLPRAPQFIKAVQVLYAMNVLIHVTVASPSMTGIIAVAEYDLVFCRIQGNLTKNIE